MGLASNPRRPHPRAFTLAAACGANAGTHHDPAARSGAQRSAAITTHARIVSNASNNHHRAQAHPLGPRPPERESCRSLGVPGIAAPRRARPAAVPDRDEPVLRGSMQPDGTAWSVTSYLGRRQGQATATRALDRCCSRWDAAFRSSAVSQPANTRGFRWCARSRRDRSDLQPDEPLFLWVCTNAGTRAGRGARAPG